MSNCIAIVIAGEYNRGATTFYKAATRQKEKELERPSKASWKQKLVFHCSYGGEAKEGAASDHPSLSQISGKRATKVHRHLSCKRSCPVQFSVKQLYLHPDVACITYYSADHKNHGANHLPSEGTRFEFAPHISEAKRAWVQHEYLRGLDRPGIYVKFKKDFAAAREAKL